MRLSVIISLLSLSLQVSAAHKHSSHYSHPSHAHSQAHHSYAGKGILIEESLPPIHIEMFKIKETGDPHLAQCLNSLRATEAKIKTRLITPLNKRKFYELYNPAVRKINKEISTLHAVIPRDQKKYKKILLANCAAEKKLLNHFIQIHSTP